MNTYPKFFFAILFALCFNQVNAQTQKVSGNILSKSNQPLDYASVALIHLPDSVSQALQATNEKGIYEFNAVKPGKYLIKALMMGYDRNQSIIFEVKEASVKVPTIILTDRSENLQTVNIISKMPLIDQKADRVILNVEQMNTTGDNALEVLSRAPGVTLDKDENIILKGKKGINVLIDGKMSYMSGMELTTYLKSLPASVVSKIELISNPPSSFDAAGTAGIINIKFKRNKIQGFNGNTNLGGGYGKYEKVYGGVNLNYNVGKLSTYVRLNAGHYNSYNRLTLNRTIGDDQYNQVNFWHPITNSLSFSTGADYFINDKHTIGVMIKGDNSPFNTKVNSNSVSYNGTGSKTGATEMYNPQTNENNNHAFNLNYRLKTDTLGGEIGVDADYVRYNNSKNETFTNTYLDANNALIGNPIDLRNAGMGSVSIYSIKADYTVNFSKSVKMETGLKSSWVKSASDVRFDSLKTAGWINDIRRTNQFNYSENINAGYLSMSKNFKNFDLKAGVRAEQTIGNGNSSQTNTLIARKYWKLFPSVFASLKLDSNNLVTGAYRKSINRPAYSSLNPFTFYTDPYTAIQGNPLLQPSYSNSFEFNYSFKNYRLLTLSYSVGTESINDVIYQNNLTKESISRPENLNKDISFYVATGSPFDVTKWWNNNSEIALAYNKTQSLVQGNGFSASSWSWAASFGNTFTLPNSYSISLDAYYSSPAVMGLFKSLENYQVNIGAKKTFWKKNATVALKMNDVFNTSKFRANLQYNNINTFWQNEWESRKVSLSFSYKFGNMKIKTARNRRTGTGDEENRIKN
ncbi:TonB-dependent receptor [Pedobacter changchengzhani]|uniref:TonB-dependent receptor n=1 Tax=Pedobacter changchengzhani TaxID=2529274 RepID=A0A4R5MM66_9SPHI|nr:outer membrane beta-barrel family protein [Pedobacter changchengzhani]TDG36758.1 TonB-dependent receptor [Pedobacter changchengzhani]